VTRPTTGVPKLALTPTEAAQALSVIRHVLDEHILPELRVIRRAGRS